MRASLVSREASDLDAHPSARSSIVGLVCAWWKRKNERKKASERAREKGRGRELEREVSHRAPFAPGRADYARRDPLVPGHLPGCQPLPQPQPRGIASSLPIPQAKIVSMQTRHELRQALGPTFSHMAEAQLMKMLRALALRAQGTDAGGAGAETTKTREGKLTLENLVEAFGVWVRPRPPHVLGSLLACALRSKHRGGASWR